MVFIYDFHIDYRSKISENPPEIFYLPDAKFINPFVLSYKNLAADLIWVKSIGYFADQFLGPRDFRYLEKLLYIIADLDPMFEKVYLWGGSVLMYNGNWISERRIKQSTEFLKYGWNKIKNQEYDYRHTWDYWRIPHMIGFNYAIELRDIDSALPYLEELSRIPEAPDFYRTWISTIYRKSGKKDEAARVLELELVAENLRTLLSQEMEESLREKTIGRLMYIYKQIYDREEAEKRLKDLRERVNRLKMFYTKEFPYMTKEMFFMVGADKVVDLTEKSFLGLLYHDRIP
jgi:hypothetical protein